MEKHLVLDESIVMPAIEAALKSKDGLDFFLALRGSLKDQIMTKAKEVGFAFAPDQSIGNINKKSSVFTELQTINIRGEERWKCHTINLQFCLGYGVESYSCNTLNWLHRDAMAKPSLVTMIKTKKPPISLGNLCFVLKDVDYDSIIIDVRPPLSVIGYSYDLGPRKRKPNFCIWGIYIDREYLIEKYTNYHRCRCSRSMLTQVVVDINKVVFVCKKCGQTYMCDCFKKAMEDALEFNRTYKYSFRPGICHLCTKTIPIHRYGHPMYHSEFMQKYLPYYNVYMKRNPDMDPKEIENKMRDDLGFPRIGEKWISETLLYKMICELCPETEIIFHSRPDWLNGLELDIYLPELRIGVEYQGIQHYKPVKHWGGKTGLKKVQARDEQKVKICEEYGVNLIYFTYLEDLSPALVQERLKDHLIASKKRFSQNT